MHMFFMYMYVYLCAHCTCTCVGGVGTITYCDVHTCVHVVRTRKQETSVLSLALWCVAGALC